MNVRCRTSPGGDRAQFWWVDGDHVRRSSARCCVFFRSKLDLSMNRRRRAVNGPHPPASARPREPDRRRRGRRAAGLGRQGAGRERDRRRRAPHRRHRRARRQEADSRRGRRRGDGAGGRAAGDRAARDEQDRAAPTISARSARSASAARRCRASRRSRISCCARARAAARPAPRSASTAAPSRRCARSARPKGTSIEVADLFYNLPARRKFLKSDTAESAQVSRLVTQLALGYPEVGFTLTSGGRTAAAVSAGGGAARAVLPAVRRAPRSGRGAQGGRRPARSTATSRRSASRGRPAAPQNVFVNRRIVKDRTIAHAIIEAYSVATIKERSPEVHLFIAMPPDRVDVNVHPTKAEVRFLEQSLVHEVLRRALGDALGQGSAPELQLTSAPASAPPEPRADDHSRACSPARSVGNRWCAKRWRRADPRSRTRRLGDRGTPGLATRDADQRPRDRRPRYPADDPARPVPRHVHHRGRRRGDRDHRSARRARARAVRAGDGAADDRPPGEPAAADADARSSCRPRSARRCCSTPPTLERFGLEVEEFGGDSVRAVGRAGAARPARSARPRCARSPRTSKGSIAARGSRTRCGASPRRWRAMPRSRRTIR